MSRTLRYALIGLGAFFGLIVVAILAILLMPVDVYRGQIEAAAEQATGRKLSIGGDLSLTLYPTLGITADQVAFANAPGRPEQMAVVENLVVGVELMPLLSGDLRVTDLVLQKPVIHLEVDKSGKPNWRFDAIKPPPDQQQPVATAEGGEALKSLSLGDVRIVDGTIIYFDARTNTTETFDSVDATITLPSLDDPLHLDGDLVFNREALDVGLFVKRPRAFMDSGKTQVTLKLGSEIVTSSFDGALTTSTGAVNGHLNLTTESVRRLAAWAGSPLPEGNGFGPLNVKGIFAIAGDDLSFKNATLSLDGMNGTGAFAVSTGGRVPVVKGTLALDRLDLNTYSAKGDAAATTSPAGAPAGPGAGWNDTPMDLAGLKGFNADLVLTVGEFLVQRIKMGKSALALKLTNGVMTADLRELALYEGAGKGTFTLDSSKAAPVVKTTLTLDAVKALPLMTDAAQMSFLEGIGTLTLDVSGTGRSQAAIMRSLSGKGSLKFVDGAIKGVNLAQIARTLQSVVTGGGLGGNLYGESAKTDFAELGGTFTIANGVLSNQDLRLLNPFVRMAGKGVIDIGGRTIKYRVEPKAVGSMEGQGGQADASGLGVPFLISGTWSKLSFEPDVGGLLEGTIQDVLSGKGVQLPGLQGTGENGKNAKPEDILKGIFGGKPKAAPPAPAAQPEPQSAPAAESAPIQPAPAENQAAPPAESEPPLPQQEPATEPQPQTPSP